MNVHEVGRDEGLNRVSLFARQACLAERCGDQANIFKPCFCTIMYVDHRFHREYLPSRHGRWAAL